MRKTIFHIDVNSAYLSWSAAEALYRGGELDYRTIPSVVGGNPETRHGIVLAKSIPAKKYNIQTAETLYQALQKCPHLYIVKPDYELYVRCSEAMRELLSEYSDRMQIYSIDECFLDMTGMEKLFGDPVHLSHHIRARIRRELGFTVSIGISSNRLLAKVASDIKKPDATVTLFPEEIAEKMWPLPVRDLFMIGPATEQKLHMLGIRTIGQLAAMDPLLLRKHLKSHGDLIWNYANGQEHGLVQNSFQERSDPKGMGNSTTTGFDVTDRREAELILLSLTETVATRLRAARLAGRVVSVAIRNNRMETSGHQRKLVTALNQTSEIHRVVMELFDQLWDRHEPLRLLGLRVTDLQPEETVQLSLFDQRNNTEKLMRLDRTIDKLRQRYGKEAIYRASFLGSGIKPISGGMPHDDMPLMSSALER